VWKPDAFKKSLQNAFPSIGIPEVAIRTGLEEWELGLLLDPAMPRYTTLAPHPSEVRVLERILSCDARSAGWIENDPEAANVAIEESHPVLEARPTGELRVRWEGRADGATEDFLLRFVGLASRTETCGVGQTLRFVKHGIQFLALDSYGTHRYVDAGRDVGIEVRILNRWQLRSIPRQLFWLRPDRIR
jgi:hypothetical protein